VQTQPAPKKPKSGRATKGDSIILTFAGPVDPSLIVPSWTGADMTVTLFVADNGPNDILSVQDSVTGAQLSALGSVQLGGNYADNVAFAGSTMTASGSWVVVVLGTPSKAVQDVKKATTMTWTTPGGSAVESGRSDIEF
jgi:hypothetical protein